MYIGYTCWKLIVLVRSGWRKLWWREEEGSEKQGSVPRPGELHAGRGCGRGRWPRRLLGGSCAGFRHGVRCVDDAGQDVRSMLWGTLVCVCVRHMHVWAAPACIASGAAILVEAGECSRRLAPLDAIYAYGICIVHTPTMHAWAYIATETLRVYNLRLCVCVYVMRSCLAS
jgi:hypothetical protein